METLAVLIPYFRSSSNVALSCRQIHAWIRKNGFKIQTLKGYLCLENISFYKSLSYDTDSWLNKIILRSIRDNRLTNLRLALEHKGLPDQEALFRAIFCDRRDCLELLLDHKADPDGTLDIDPHGTPIMHASTWKREECLKLLLDRGADMETKDDWGFTAFDSAIVTDRNGCAKVLYDYGAMVRPYHREFFTEPRSRVNVKYLSNKILLIKEQISEIEEYLSTIK